MPVFRRVHVYGPDVMALHDVPGHESGRVRHGGDCPLRGQVRINGHHTPGCGDACTDPTEPIFVEQTWVSLVLAVKREAALVWDHGKAEPVWVVLERDEILNGYAKVDALPGLRALFSEWIEYQKLEAEFKREKHQKTLAEEAVTKELLEEMAALKEQEEREKRRVEEIIELEATARRLEAELQARIRKAASALRPGRRVRIVADPPGVAERNAKLKPRNRTPSLIGQEALIVEGGHQEFIFIRLPEGTKRTHFSTVRVILKDGSLGDLEERT
jgi:hypothetical protein